MFGSVINKSRPWVRRPFWIKRLEKPMTLRRSNELMFLAGVAMGLFFIAAVLGVIEICTVSGLSSEVSSLATGMATGSILAWAAHRELQKIEARYALVDTAAETQGPEA